MKWLLGCGILSALAFILFVVAAGLEGPVLVPSSPGHGLSLVDVVALVPLAGRVTAGVWVRLAPKTSTGTVARSGSLVVVGGLVGCWGVAG
jgi:hypothetical protein